MNLEPIGAWLSVDAPPDAGEAPSGAGRRGFPALPLFLSITMVLLVSGQFWLYTQIVDQPSRPEGGVALLPGSVLVLLFGALDLGAGYGLVRFTRVRPWPLAASAIAGLLLGMILWASIGAILASPGTLDGAYGSWVLVGWLVLVGVLNVFGLLAWWLDEAHGPDLLAAPWIMGATLFVPPALRVLFHAS